MTMFFLFFPIVFYITSDVFFWGNLRKQGVVVHPGILIFRGIVAVMGVIGLILAMINIY